jgi:outer membrane protein
MLPVQHFLTQPLLKGRGKKVTTTSENIARKNVQNLQDEYSFTISSEILQLSFAYWQYLTAYRSLEIYTGNEKRVRNVLEVTNELVKADKRPAGDLSQVYAELANQERQTKVAEQNLFEAKLNLGSVIGLSVQSSMELQEPLNDFPNVFESGFKQGMSEATFMQLALSNRMDIKARQKAKESLELQKYSAEKNLKPQLDLTGFVTYGGQSIGNGFDNTMATFANNEGRSLGGGFNLSFTLPVNNNLAKGNYLQVESSLMNQYIINENLERIIHLNVFSALSNLENSVIVLNKAEESLTQYRKAFQNEETKFQNGLTTLLNLLIFQERLTYAELEYLQSHQQFATAIIKLRYETGTLIKEDESGTLFINNETFYTIPSQN